MKESVAYTNFDARIMHGGAPFPSVGHMCEKRRATLWWTVVCAWSAVEWWCGPSLPIAPFRA
jgi:hypothetical protein